MSYICVALADKNEKKYVKAGINEDFQKAQNGVCSVSENSSLSEVLPVCLH